MDVAVPMACQPGAMSGRNWMMRRLLIDSIRNDPEWNNGNYTAQPRSMQRPLTYFSIATSGGNIALYNAAPTAAQGDALLAKRLAAPFRGDANDVLYQWESSADYNPSPRLERIQATVLAINSADDERNPPELGMMERAMKRVKNGRLLLIPESADTRGHGTTGMAKFYKKELAELLQTGAAALAPGAPDPNGGAADYCAFMPICLISGASSAYSSRCNFSKCSGGPNPGSAPCCSELLARRRLLQHAHRVGIDPGDEPLRQPPRRDEAEPRFRPVLGESRFRARRHVGQRLGPLGRADRQRPQRSGLEHPHDRGQRIDVKLDRARDQRAAAVGADGGTARARR